MSSTDDWFVDTQLCNACNDYYCERVGTSTYRWALSSAATGRIGRDYAQLRVTAYRPVIAMFYYCSKVTIGKPTLATNTKKSRVHESTRYWISFAAKTLCFRINYSVIKEDYQPGCQVYRSHHQPPNWSFFSWSLAIVLLRSITYFALRPCIVHDLVRHKSNILY